MATLLQAMAAQDIGINLHQLGAQYLASGVTAKVAMGSLVNRWPEAPPLAEGSIVPQRGLSVVYSSLRAGIPVTVTIIDPAGEAATDSLKRFRLQFCAFLDAAQIDRRLLGLCLASSELPSPELRTELRPSLGDGPRYVMLHDPLDLSMQARKSREDIWQLLRIEENGEPRFWPAFAAGVRSQCPLLSGESSSVVQPGSGLVAPKGSAWLPLTIDLCNFADARGVIDRERLDAALDACVELGDRLLDAVSWFDDSQHRDARNNRRLAICIEGIGDLVVRRGSQPDEFATLRDLDRLLSEVRRRLWSSSRRLAKLRGPLPSLTEHAPRPTCDDNARRRDWQRRWQSALDSGQVRNRNLLAMSPYALFPRTSTVRPSFADLLPLLAHADALCFADPPSLKHWKTNDFIGFHRRLAAQVRRNNAAAFVAAGV